MKTWCTVASCMLLAAGTPAVAGQAPQPIDQASMLVDGSVTVDAAGNVIGYTLVQPGKLPSPVVTLLGKTVPGWHFEPVLRHGKPVTVKSDMHLRVLARPTGDGNFTLSVGSSWFSGGGSDDVLAAKQRKAPTYPRAAIRDRVSGTVYLVAEIDRQGHVDKLATEQVNLRAPGSEGQMERWRKLLADASIDAVRGWTFETPASGSEAGKQHWIRRIPIDFRLQPYPPGHKRAPAYMLSRQPEIRPAYGQWISYIPGPRQEIPWLPQHDVSRNDVDALPSGGIYTAGQGLHRIDAPGS